MAKIKSAKIAKKNNTLSSSKNKKQKIVKNNVKPNSVIKKTKKLNKFKVAKTNVFKIEDNNFEQKSENRSKSKVSSNKKHIKNSKNENISDTETLDETNQDYDEIISSHKKSLAKLQSTDPEFYSFLQENDKRLLDFNISGSEDEEKELDEASDEDGDSDNEVNQKYHKPIDKLEVASDESDFEPENDAIGISKIKDSRKITLKTLKQWRESLQTDKTSQTINCIVQAFHAALINISGDTEKETYAEYIVESPAIFNGIIQICVLELQPAIKRFLKIPAGSKQPPHKFKKFKKIKKSLENYLNDLYKLLSGVTSSNILTILLKHLHHMSNIIVSFPKTTRSILKKLVAIWSTADETVRVVAYLCILRITNNQRHYLETVLKTMYVAYVTNAKFVSPTTLPHINFMRRSLVELYLIDPNRSYTLTFLYIRQLAIHVRNAITLQKAETVKTVYNWQFINSLRFWAEFLAATGNIPQLRSIICPFVVVCLETIKLVPTTQYYPLRFHCVDVLITLIKGTGIYVPVLPFLYEILDKYDFNKKHKKVSMKPMQFTCILRLSKSQLLENGFKDAVIEVIYNSIVEFLAALSHNIAFPDLVVPLNIEIKTFLKKCSVRNYCKKMQQLLQKIEENSKMIEKARDNITCKISDVNTLYGFENQIKNEGTPLHKYYVNWSKINEIQKNKRVTKNEEIADYALPTIKRIKKPANQARDGPVTLFPSDSEENDALPIEEEPKREKRIKKKRPKAKQSSEETANKYKTDSDNEAQDTVHDISVSEW